MSTLPLLSKDVSLSPQLRSNMTFIGPTASLRQPIRVLQFGEGRLLRALIDPLFETLRRDFGFNGRIAMSNLRESGQKNISGLKSQDGLYTIFLRQDQEITAEVIGGVVPYDRDRDWENICSLAGTTDLLAIITNATESGVVLSPEEAMPPGAPKTVVGLVTAVLFACWQSDPASLGPLILPTELLPSNGQKMKSLVLTQARRWCFSDPFLRWIEDSRRFINTLVDRVVTGSNPDPQISWRHLGYTDYYSALCEKYGRWWIEATPDVLASLPLYHCEEVQLVDDLTEYHHLKVYGLNGVHLLIASWGLLRGHTTVADAFADPLIRRVAESYFATISRVIDLPEDETKDFFRNLRKRFAQIWLHHRLNDIAVRLLDKWWIRIAPALDRFWQLDGNVPQPLVQTTITVLGYLRKENGQLKAPTAQEVATQLALSDRHEHLWASTLIHAVVAGWIQEFS